MERLQDRTRKVVNVAEVHGMEGNMIIMQDPFLWEQVGAQNGRLIGPLKSTGLRLKFAKKVAININELPADIFTTGNTI
jgi:pilus assembly protein CpaF